MQSLQDRVMVVTGGAGAIGRPIVRAFAEAGARVAVVDQHRGATEPVAAEVGGLPLAVDLSTAAGADQIVREVLARWGRLDGLVHTVGGFAMGRVYDSDPALYDKMFDLNVRTLFNALRSVVPELLKKGEGFIAGFASEPAWTGAAPGSSLYGAAKSAVAHLLRSLDAELKGTEVAVSIVYPMGAVDTPANRRDMPDFDPARYIDPVEIADTIVFAARRGPRARLRELPVFPRR
jgi:NAD(P)-dependent dehydrogenase (short-subunit alcohol dehydrogenase family)